MYVKDVTAKRVEELCKQNNISINELANRAGVTPSSIYSMLDTRRRNVSITLIKKICDGFDMTLREFFSTDTFDNLDQEIK